MNRRIYEAQRFLRLANEINPEATALVIEAIQKLAEAGLINRAALYYIYRAVSAKMEKERAA